MTVDVNPAFGFILTFSYSQPGGAKLLGSGSINVHSMIGLFKQVKSGSLI